MNIDPLLFPMKYMQRHHQRQRNQPNISISILAYSSIIRLQTSSRFKSQNLMFHCFDHQIIKLPKRQAGRIILAVPLDNNQLVAVDDNQILMQYRLPSGSITNSITLPFKVRRITVINDNTLAVLAPQEKSLYQIQLATGKITAIHTFETGFHFNSHHILREKENFSTMQLGSFNLAQTCFLRQERTEERKIKLHFFQKQNSNLSTKNLTKNEGEDKWSYKSHEQNMNSCLTDKFDEKSKVVFWKQQIENNSQFEFSTLDFSTEAQNEVHNLVSISFTTFSIVRAVRSHSTGVLVCLNHKTPEILFFNFETQTNSQQIRTNLIWIVSSQSFLLNLSLSEEEKSSGTLQLRKLAGELMDKAEVTFDETCVSRSGELILSYTKQRKDNGWFVIQAIRVLRKQKLVLHLLEKTHGNKLPNTFMRQVLSLLQ